jgi:GT2 family glycosyltransferase
MYENASSRGGRFAAGMTAAVSGDLLHRSRVDAGKGPPYYPPLVAVHSRAVADGAKFSTLPKDLSMEAPDLAIIVTSYQMPWHVRRVLESIAAQRTSRRMEVVVADDGSTDETPRLVAEFAAGAPFPVRFATHAHAGFHAARCRNDGVRNSSAPHLLFVDGDCLLPPDHVEQHLRAARPGIVTCGYCVRLDQAVSQQATVEAVRGGKFIEWATPEQRSKLRHMHYKAIWYTMIGHPTKPAFRSGNFSLARSDFERINGFDENFLGWGCEDDDFGRRLRAAEIRSLSVLNRTCVYHLWHPPAPTRPAQWKQGGNVAYLQRTIRLTRCASGLMPRSPSDLTVRLTDETPGGPRLLSLLLAHGWAVETSRRQRTDLELMCCPGRGRFTARTDCRVLAFFNEALYGRFDSRAAHVVLSPSGCLGSADQVRLRLDDTDGIWAVLQGRVFSTQRAAA